MLDLSEQDYRCYQGGGASVSEPGVLLLTLLKIIMESVMKKTLMGVLPAFLAILVFDANAGYVPYESQAVQKVTPAEYDQNNDSYITADEVEVELREDAIDKAIRMQKKGASQEAIDRVIIDMEDSIEEDAEVIINILDKDGDELVEPNELK